MCISRQLILGGFAMVLALGCRTSREKAASLQATPPLADSLVTIFAELQEAVLKDDSDRFLSLLDPREAAKLQSLVRKRGFRSLRLYLEKRFANWPLLDTLMIDSLHQAGEYARLAMIGAGSHFGRRKERITYTFLLFRRSEDKWRLSAMTSLEKDKYDPYGYELTYHETDLPPRLRFPRHL